MIETPTELEQLQAEFDRFRRRARCNARKAQADGLLMVVLSMLTPRDVVCNCGANVGDVTAQLSASGLFDKTRLTVAKAHENKFAETHENKFKELRPRFRALRERLSEAYPITRVNLDWI